MKIEVFPIDFVLLDADPSDPSADVVRPSDPRVWSLAEDFIQREMAPESRVPISRLRKAWIACEVDSEGNPVRALGGAGISQVVDIPWWRVVGDQAIQVHKKLRDRINSYLADNGMRGQEVFVFMSGDARPETRCANWQDAIEMFGAKPAHRFTVKVR